MKSLWNFNEGAATHYHKPTLSPPVTSHYTHLMPQDTSSTNLHGSKLSPLSLSAVEYLPQHGPPTWINESVANYEIYEQSTDILSLSLSLSLIFDNIIEGALILMLKSDGYYALCPVPR